MEATVLRSCYYLFFAFLLLKGNGHIGLYTIPLLQRCQAVALVLSVCVRSTLRTYTRLLLVTLGLGLRGRRGMMQPFSVLVAVGVVSRVLFHGKLS